MLHAPDVSLPFILQTDASDTGLGAVLSQYSKGKEHSVLYISCKLTPAEAKYAAVQKEALAIKWAIQELRYYILGIKCTLCTDHAPLQWMAHTKDRARVANGNADGLSRMFAGWSGLLRDTPLPHQRVARCPPPTPKSSEMPIIQLASLLATAITSASSTDWRQLSSINSSRGERCKGHNKPQLGEEDPMSTDLSNVCSFLFMKRLRSRPSRQHSHHHSTKKQTIPKDQGSPGSILERRCPCRV